MSGMILAALGKGVADFGNTYGAMAMRRVQADEDYARRRADASEDHIRRREDLDYASKLDEKKQENLARIKVDAEEALNLRKQERLSEQQAKISTGAAAIGDVRDLSQANRVAPSVTPESMGLIKSALSPEEMQKYYGVKPKTELSGVNDEIEAGTSAGAHEALAQLHLKKKDILAELKEERKISAAATVAAATKEADGIKDDTRNKQILAVLKASGDRTQAYRDRPVGGGGGGGGDGDSKSAREERLRYTTLFTDAGKRLAEAQTSLGKVMPGKMGDAERASLQDSIKTYKEERALYQGFLAESQSPGAAPKPSEKGEPKPAAPTVKPMASLPAGAKQVGTSGGKPVYQTPDGKRFIGN